MTVEVVSLGTFRHHSAHVVACENPPATTFVIAMFESRGWRAFARHDEWGDGPSNLTAREAAQAEAA